MTRPRQVVVYTRVWVMWALPWYSWYGRHVEMVVDMAWRLRSASSARQGERITSSLIASRSEAIEAIQHFQSAPLACIVGGPCLQHRLRLCLAPAPSALARRLVRLRRI